MRLFDLSDKVAIVTGGNGGIGLGMAKGLAEAGAKIAIVGRNTDKNASAVKEIKSLGATVNICKTPDDILHFKSECSVLDDDVILLSNKMAQLDYLKSNYHLIELPIGEEGASNSLRINDKLLLPDGFIESEEILSKNYNIIKVKVDEIAKVDAGLSCMSLRW